MAFFIVKNGVIFHSALQLCIHVTPSKERSSISSFVVVGSAVQWLRGGGGWTQGYEGKAEIEGRAEWERKSKSCEGESKFIAKSIWLSRNLVILVSTKKLLC